jgi:hypothetical protein
MPKRRPTILQDPLQILGKSFDIVLRKLNGTDEDSDELRSLVIRWKDSGPNLEKMLHADQDLWKDLREAIPAVWTPSSAARACFAPLPSGLGHKNDTPVRKARFNFAMFVLHPQCDLLGGPCKICGKWFEQKTRHRTRFCTRKCASLATAPAAIQTTKTRREEARKRRLNWAREAIGKWSFKHRTEGWKSWVLRHVNDQERIWAKNRKEPEPSPLTEKWLTRWITKGQLQDPSTKKEREIK